MSIAARVLLVLKERSDARVSVFLTRGTAQGPCTWYCKVLYRQEHRYTLLSFTFTGLHTKLLESLMQRALTTDLLTTSTVRTPDPSIGQTCLISAGLWLQVCSRVAATVTGVAARCVFGRMSATVGEMARV